MTRTATQPAATEKLTLRDKALNCKVVGRVGEKYIVRNELNDHRYYLTAEWMFGEVVACCQCGRAKYDGDCHHALCLRMHKRHRASARMFEGGY